MLQPVLDCEYDVKSSETVTKPIVALISNCLSKDNSEYINASSNLCAEGVLKPYSFSYKNQKGIIPVLDILPTEMLSVSGMKKSKKYFINAVKYAVKQGVKVILLAASTKRLFGDGSELKSLFPDVTFTIGDNGTTLAFLKQIDYVTQNTNKQKPVVVLGAGFLGEMAINHLKSKGFQKIIVISKHRIKNQKSEYQFTSLDSYIASDVFEKASLFLGCAHNHAVTLLQLEALVEKQLVIIDVAVPNAVPKEIMDENDNRFARFDGGDYEIKNLELDFNFQQVGLNFKNEFYGCFTEAFLLAMNTHNSNNDFFKVNNKNLDFISQLLSKYKDDITVSNRNFGQLVKGFNHQL